MDIGFVHRITQQSGAVAVFSESADGLTGAAAAFDSATGGQVRRALRAARFGGNAGEVCEILAPNGSKAARLLVLGIGERRKVGVPEFERIGGILCARLLYSGDSSLTIEAGDMPETAVESAAVAAHLAFGIILRAYRFDRYRTEVTSASTATLTQVNLVVSQPKIAQARFRRLEAVAEGIFLARDLVSEPANVLYPKAFAARIADLARHRVRVQVLGEKQLKKLGFGALLGVSQGSVQEPQVVICEYNGLAGRRTQPPVVLAGKGVTFDSGGISLKGSAGMESMKQDMGGAAAVIGALKTLAVRKARCHVVGICGLVENMPSGMAQRPGDVVTSLSGKTIEIINTDAEGRLLLSDILWYVQERYKPRVLIDMATLTGAIVIALGQDYAGLFCNDSALAAQIIAAGRETGDRCWQFPMGASYDKLLASTIADMKNIGPSEGRSIIAAQFIQRFVQPGVAWAHVDFGGMVWTEENTPLAPKGATGFGVRLLDQLIATHYES